MYITLSGNDSFDSTRRKSNNENSSDKVPFQVPRYHFAFVSGIKKLLSAKHSSGNMSILIKR